MKHLQIGCSGYYYPEWKNKFYPSGLSSAQWLEYYSSVFSTVELNGTFYGKLNPAELKRYYNATPADFAFSVKASRHLTHVLKLKDAFAAVCAFTELVQESLGDKLDKMLFQLPPSFEYSEENLERVFESIPPAPKNVLDFRHASWWEEEVIEKLRKAAYVFCNIDSPGLQRPFVFTSTHFYLRLHGAPDLFRSSYSEKELEEFYRAIPQDMESCNIYFNNTANNAAWKNAQSLMQIFRQDQNVA